MVRLTDRPFSIATSESRPVRFVRTHVVPRLVPLALRFDVGRASVYRRLAQLEIRYRESLIVHEGRPRLRHGPRAGERPPDAALTRDERPVRLQRELSGPCFDLLLCGPARAWDARRLSALRERLDTLLAVHRLTREPAPRMLVDASGEAFSRLGVGEAAHHLVRPDRHIAYRAGGTDLEEMPRYLARWVTGTGTERAHT